MISRDLTRGILVVALSLGFGLAAALLYPLGRFDRPGPGLFPLLVSAMLFVLGIAIIARSFLTSPEPLQFDVRNISVIMLSLSAFVVLTKLVSMIAGITALVFVASVAATSRSFRRSAAVSAVLVVIAFGFQLLLGLNLKLP